MITKEQVYEAAIEAVIDGVKETPETSAIAIKNFLQTILDQNKTQPKQEA